MTYESTFTLLHMNSQWVFKGTEKMMKFQNKHCQTYTCITSLTSFELILWSEQSVES